MTNGTVMISANDLRDAACCECAVLAIPGHDMTHVYPMSMGIDEAVKYFTVHPDHDYVPEGIAGFAWLDRQTVDTGETEQYDYTNQAWLRNGRYIPCNHPVTMDCTCYGSVHAGELVDANAEVH